MPASWAAAVNVGQDRTTSLAGVMPGSITDEPAVTVTEWPKLSLPVNDFSTSAAAALKVLCHETYSANGGVGKNEGWQGSHLPPSMIRVPSPGPPHAGTRRGALTGA